MGGSREGEREGCCHVLPTAGAWTSEEGRQLRSPVPQEKSHYLGQDRGPSSLTPQMVLCLGGT